MRMDFAFVRDRFPARDLTRATAGFTLIELLAVTAIIVMVTGVTLAGNARYGGVILLQNLAYDIALSIRQAQVYGISVARFGQASFTSGYGIHFDTSNPTSYAIFADAITADGLYTCPTPGATSCELIDAPIISRGYKIKSLCAPAGESETCLTASAIDIIFKRPEPDAWISASGNSCELDHNLCMESARVIVVSPRGDTMSVIISAAGQISVRHGN